MKKVVLTYGTFDLFHVGHLRLLQRLRATGDELVVGVSTDEFNASKGKETVISFDDRIEIVRALRCVDKAIPENAWDQKTGDVREHGITTFGIGEDWRGQFDWLQDYCEVVYLPRTQDVSTTQLKEVLRVVDPTHIDELKAALDMVSSIVERMQ